MNKINAFLAIIFQNILKVPLKLYLKDKYEEAKIKQIVLKIIKYTYVFLAITITLVLLNIDFSSDERKQINEINYIDFTSDDKYINLDLEIENEIREVKIKYPKKEPTDEDIVDRIFKVLNQDTIKGMNKSLTYITTDLNLITKNSYGANIEWESEKGYINVNDGSVLRPFADDEDYKDILKLTVTYKDIKKVKEFKIIIIHQGITSKDNDIENIYKEMSNGNTYNENKLIDSKNGYDLKWYIHKEKKENNSIAILILSLFIYVLMCINEFKKYKKEENDKGEKIENDFVEIVEDYYLLEIAGYNLTNSLLYINDRYENDNELKKYLNQMCNRINLGFNTFDTFVQFGRDSKSIKIQKIIKEIIIKLKRDESNLDLFLRDKINELNKNKKIVYERKAEENNIKALLPLMIVLIATMILVVYPAIVAMNF